MSAFYGGRPCHNLWQEGFRREKKSNGKPFAVCCLCQKHLQNTSAHRLQMHRNVCPALVGNGPKHNQNGLNIRRKRRTAPHFPEIIASNQSDIFASPNLMESNLILPNVTEDMSCSNTTTLSFNVQTTESQGTSKSSVSTEESAEKQVFTPNTLSPQQLKNSHLMLAKFFFGCNIPFSAIESVHFKEFCDSLHPSYKLPGKHALTGYLLDEIYESNYTSLKFEECSVLLMDVSGNENGTVKNVMGMLRGSTNEALYLDTWQLSTESESSRGEDRKKLLPCQESSAQLEEIISLAKQEAQKQFHTNIYAVVTNDMDNSAGIIGDTWCILCNSHLSQLLAKEIVPEAIVSQVRDILSAFSGTDTESLLKISGKQFIYPREMRWECYCESFQSLLDNLPFMKDAVTEGMIEVPKNIKMLIADGLFINSVKWNFALLDSVRKLVERCQIPKATIADAVEEWLSIEFPETSQNVHSVLDIMRNRALNSYSLAANFLHPSYFGRKLSEVHLNKVDMFLIEELDTDGLNDLQAFRERTGLFGMLDKKSGLAPEVYWGLAKRKHPALSSLALKLLKIPASSPHSECAPCSHSYIHNFQSQLTPSRFRKLLSVYYKLKMQDNRTNEY